MLKLVWLSPGWFGTAVPLTPETGRNAVKLGDAASVGAHRVTSEYEPPEAAAKSGPEVDGR